MRFQVRQQANATTVIFGETKALFESMVSQAEDETISQISTIYQHRNFEPIGSAVRGFFSRLRGMFAHSRYNQIVAEHEFEKFLIELTGKVVLLKALILFQNREVCGEILDDGSERDARVYSKAKTTKRQVDSRKSK